MLESLIAIDAAPNMRGSDVTLALRLLLTPWRWKKGEGLSKLKSYFQDHYHPEEIVVTQSGRAALYMLLSATISSGDEVITQAFTCLVVPNAISWAGGMPVFVDIDSSTYNIDLADLKKKITKKTKVIIVQHTFGIPANLYEIQKICREHGLVLIEDCAHALGVEYDRKLVGTYGDGAIFSFNQDKVVSGINGGVVIVNNKDIAQKIKDKYSSLRPPSQKSIFKALLHPLLWSLALPLYDTVKIGKGIVFLSWKIGILGNTVTLVEQKGDKPKHLLQSMSNAQAELVLQGLERLEKDNARRIEIATRYKKELNYVSITHPKHEKNSKTIYLRYPIQVENPQNLFQTARKEGVIFGKWYDTPIFPWNDTAAKYYSMGYYCLVAEKVGKKVVNLPTYPRLTDKDINRVVEAVREIYGDK